MVIINPTTEIVLNWLDKNEPEERFHSPSHAKAFVARKLGVPLSKVKTKMDVKDCLILEALKDVSWEYIYSQYKKKEDIT